MVIYCYYTPSYEILVNEWFRPSLKDNFEVILIKGTYQKQAVNYQENGWYDITREKTEYIIKAIQDNWNEVFIFSDPDIQFFLKTENCIRNLSKNRDLVLQRDSPSGKICSGFFALRGNDKTLRLWQDIYNLIGSEKGDDQDCLNSLMLITSNFLIKCLYKLLDLKTKYQFSKYGLNPYGIKWEYLPKEFLSGGNVTGRYWKPGMSLELPKNIIMHHANWTVGLKNKLAQLEHVKTLFQENKVK